MELLQIELSKVKDQLDNTKEPQRERLFIFLLVFFTNVFVVIGENSDLNLQIILIPPHSDPSFSMALLYAAVIIFLIGQYIDNMNLRKLFIFYLMVQVVFKILTCRGLILTQEMIKEYLKSFYYTSDIILNFMCSVIFFNWFSRKQLFMVFALFNIAKGVGNIAQLIYGVTGQFNQPVHEKAYIITVVVCSTLLALLIPIHYKFLYIDPLDIGIASNEYKIIADAYLPSNQQNRQIDQTLKKMRINTNQLMRSTLRHKQSLFGRLSKAYRRQTTDPDNYEILSKLSMVENVNVQQDDLEAIDEIHDSTAFSVEDYTEEVASYISQNTGSGMSLKDTINIAATFRVLFGGSLLVIRNICGYLLVKQQEVIISDDSELDEKQILQEVMIFRMLMIVVLIVIGYICMTRFKGRKTRFFYLIIAFALFIDILTIILYASLDSIASFELIMLLFLKMQYIMTQGLMFFTIYIIPLDMCKIVLLKKQKKVFGQVLGLIISFFYAINSFLLINLDTIFRKFSIPTSVYIFLSFQVCMTFPLFFIFKNEYNNECVEVTYLDECKHIPDSEYVNTDNQQE